MLDLRGGKICPQSGKTKSVYRLGDVSTNMCLMSHFLTYEMAPVGNAGPELHSRSK